MKPRRNPTPALREIIRRQEGVVTRAQALPHIGDAAIRRLVDRGDWATVTSGLYSVGTPTARHRLWAGHLLGGPESALGGEAALFLAGLRPEPKTVTVWVPRSMRKRGRPGWVFPRDGWSRLRHRSGTLPAIRTDEALIDVGQGLGLDDWVETLASAARARRVALPEVQRRVLARPKVQNRAMLLEVLADFQGIESNLEWVYLREVEQRHGLPVASRQVVRITGSRSDVRYDPYGLVVELDGLLHLQEESATCGATTPTPSAATGPCATARVPCGARSATWRGRWAAS